MNDPEMMEAMMNPKVMSVLQQAQSNLGALIAAMSDPEVILCCKNRRQDGEAGYGGHGRARFRELREAQEEEASVADNNRRGNRFTEEDAAPHRPATVDEVNNRRRKER